MTEKEVQKLEPWVAVIAVALLLLVGGVAGFTAWDRAHTTAEEVVLTPTAVGDTHYVQEPAKGSGQIGLKYNGRDLDMVGEDKVRDAKAIKVGMDDSGVYTIYRPEDETDLPKDRYYIKVKPNIFMEVTQE